MKNIIRRAVSVLLMLLVTGISIEATLEFIDPTGVRRYMKDLRQMLAHYEYRENRWHLLDGVHAFRAGTVTIEDGQRVTPATQSADCKILAVGDSVTLGWGVNDEETWVNLLAAAFPEVTLIQYAHSGWNSRDVRETIEITEADGYIYLFINNDQNPETGLVLEHALAWHFAFEDYAYVYGITREQQSAAEQASQPQSVTEAPVSSTQPAQLDWFIEDMAYFENMDNLLWFGFDEAGLAKRLVEQNTPITLLPAYTEKISQMDIHPNPTGHQQIADAMKPYVASFIEETCS